MKKFIFILFSFLLVTGCTAHYELKINDDLSVEESITGLEDDEFYNQYYNSKKERVADFVMATQMEYLTNNGFEIEKHYQDLLYGATVSKKYNTLEEFYDTSIAYKQFYKTFNLTNKNGIVDISLDDKLNRNSQDPTRYVIDEGSISIVLPFKVLEHNADEVNSDKNIYIWYINSSNDKTIHIKFDSTKKNNNLNYIFILVIGLAVIVTLVSIVIVRIYNNKQKEKDII